MYIMLTLRPLFTTTHNFNQIHTIIAHITLTVRLARSQKTSVACMPTVLRSTFQSVFSLPIYGICPLL